MERMRLDLPDLAGDGALTIAADAFRRCELDRYDGADSDCVLVPRTGCGLAARASFTARWLIMIVELKEFGMKRLGRLLFALSAALAIAATRGAGGYDNRAIRSNHGFRHGLLFYLEKTPISRSAHRR
ncbi:MAG: hypothetical protein R3C42_02785 [Parvularculaceae bacterium]